MKPSIAWLYFDWSVNDYRKEHNLYGGIGYYRVVKPAQYLKEWFDIDVIGAEFDKWGVKGGDVALKFQRLLPYDLIISKHLIDEQIASNLLGTASHYKKKLVVDVDDNYFAVRKDNPALKAYEMGQKGRYAIGTFLTLADGLVVSTDPLKKAYKKLNKNIDVLPNCNDINDWPKEKKEWNDGKIRIGFAGGLGHLDDLNLVLEPMAYILAKYPNVLWEIIGAVWPKEAMDMVNKMNGFCKKDISKQVRIAGGTMAWQGYPELLNSFGWDIVIAPLVGDDFNKSKSHIRWMENSMIHCPTIASPVYPYMEDIQGIKTIQDGITGFFAYNAIDWFKQLDRLIQDKDLRRSVADNAYEYVKNNWQYSQWAEKWKSTINKYL